ncbi:MAG: WD40/YVTN/BNR-like repeat-containing protein [Planctomycetota bacterium]|jgi:photosystem II stability/assembly factor-like uncharacterized protein
MGTRLIRYSIAFYLLAAAALASDPAFDAALLAGMKARSIGPATMSGRIAALDAVIDDPSIIYAGAATGGVWKSKNSGMTWEPIFDDQPVAAIGAVAIYQPSPDIVWVGTGEANPRNSASVGNGVYRSLDGGLTWSHLGLDETERISRIVLDPSDPDVAYAAAMGKAWGENPERGVFKTMDGGKTWKKILYVDERTGAADLVMDPKNPKKLIAAMWDYRRWPWFFRSGGPGSGIHVTYDGGETWKKRTSLDGMPEGELGRIGLAIAPSEPSVVYALVEGKAIVLMKSLDGGETWAEACKERLVGNRPFYYADIHVDPEDPERVYSLWSVVSVSIDGGKTFERLGTDRVMHPDHHAFWINPRDPDHIIDGNDGGVYISRDQGRTWRFTRNLPLGQYYHIRVDNEVPYNVYGGMQDNGSWRGPSSVWQSGGIRNFHWYELYYGDGFDTLPDPEDAMQGYAMSQEGYLARWNLRTGEYKDIRPAPQGDEELRFNWNAGLAIDPFDSKTIYYGSQFVHRSMDRGDTWTQISTDLTSNNPEWQKQDESGGLTLDVTGAENFTSITAIVPSPLVEGLIWVGTDDGRLHVTTDSGNTWSRVDVNIKGVPADTWIPHIAPSRFDSGEAFVVFDDHRRANWTPYVYKTRDFGRTWTPLATDDLWGYALVIEQDPVEQELLYLGTEFGLYISLNGGEKWFKWTHGLPTVSVMDLAVHTREHDLILGTHGRSAYILDDIRPLRTLDAAMRKDLHLFEIPPAQQHRIARAPSTRNAGSNEYRGENRPYGAILTIWLNFPELAHPDKEKERLRKADAHEALDEKSEEESDEDKDKKEPQIEVEVSGPDGVPIRFFEAPVKLGLNRVVWDLRRDPFDEVPRPGREYWEERRGPEVLPDQYTVKVRYQEREAIGKVTVLPDPRAKIPEADRTANFDAVMRAGALQDLAAEAVSRIAQTKADIETVIARKQKDKEKEFNARKRLIKKAMDEDPLVQAAKSMKKGLEKVEVLFRNPSAKQDIPPRKNAVSKIGRVLRSLQSSWDAPTGAQLRYLDEAEKALKQALEEFNRFFEEEVTDFRKRVNEAGINLLTERAPIQYR